MDQKRHDRLIKCLEMMASDQDGEAMAALRQVVKIVKEEKLQWKNIISITVDAPPQQVQTQQQPAPRPGFHPGDFGSAMGMNGQPFGSPFQNQQNPFAQQQAWANAQQNAFHAYAHAQAQMYEQMRRANAANPPPPPKQEEAKDPEIKIEDREEKKASWFRKRP